MSKKPKPEYVHFQPSAWLSDSDVQAWTDDLLGAYFRIVLYLYTNNGTVTEEQMQNLVRPCCKSATEVCKLIKHKFHRRATRLFHIRVNKELAAARKLMQAKQQAGLKGADRRWHGHKATNGTANSRAIAKESKVKESKEIKKKTKKKDRQIPADSGPQKAIFDHWNSYKGRGNWKSHNELRYEIKQAITERLKQYTVEQLTRAIDNYAKVLLSKDYGWTYPWTLRQFLTRHQKAPNQSELQLYRWLDSGFAEDDYLTPAAKARRIQQCRVAEAPPEQVKVASDDEKLRIRGDLPAAMQARLGKGAER
jgi:uncharacterized protein YdaU (DUF1376 family)